jgi:hypothetical protein
MCHQAVCGSYGLVKRKSTKHCIQPMRKEHFWTCVKWCFTASSFACKAGDDQEKNRFRASTRENSESDYPVFLKVIFAER